MFRFRAVLHSDAALHGRVEPDVLLSLCLYLDPKNGLGDENLKLNPTRAVPVA